MVKLKGASKGAVRVQKPLKRVVAANNKVDKQQLKLVSSKPTNEKKSSKKKIIRPTKEFQPDESPESMDVSRLVGDLSEEDIDSDDNFSLNDEDLPTPPDTTTEEESEAEEEEADMKESEEIDEESSKVKKTHASNEDDLQRTIFVSNLPKSVKKIKLKKWFSTYGTVEAVRLRCAPLADPTMSKKVAVIKKSFHEDRDNIHGFVRYATIAEAQNALKANGLPFDEEHHIWVDLAGKVGDKKVFDDKKSIFIGNIPFTAKEDQLLHLFADCGDVVAVRIVRDKKTSLSKGFGFINFATRNAVRLAFQKDDIELNGRKLRVQKSLYNQEVEMVPQDVRKSNKRQKNDKKENIMKFKKKKKRKEGEYEFQGLTYNQEPKPKKLNTKKKKHMKKQEVLKKILNTDSKKKSLQ